MISRPSRAILLALAVAIAACLATMVGASIDTMRASIRHVTGQMVGLAHGRIVHRFNAPFQQTLLEDAASWSGVTAVAGQVAGNAMANAVDGRDYAAAQVQGIQLPAYSQLRPPRVERGRAIGGPGEAMIGPRLAQRLSIRLGDRLRLEQSGRRLELQVVGIIERPRLGVLQQPVVMAELDQVQQLLGMEGFVHEALLSLEEGLTPEALAAAHGEALPPDVQVRHGAARAARVAQVMENARLFQLMITVLAFLAAGFIVLTGFTTAVAEQQRELAMIRCVGAPRATIAVVQLISAVVVTAGGVLLGAAAGLAVTYYFYRKHAAHLPGGFHYEPQTVAMAATAAVVTALAGAAWPALRAAMLDPSAALAARSRRPRGGAMAACLIVGLTLAAAPLVAQRFEYPIERIFWLLVYGGLPALIVGFFLLGVPVVAAVGALVGPIVAAVLRVPRSLLAQTFRASPGRYGLLSGATMLGLALLVGLWSGVRGVTEGWFSEIQMPDAFVHSYFPLPADQLIAIEDLPIVDRAAALTMFPVQAAQLQLGVGGLSPAGTFFVAADLHAFVDMTAIEWVQGERDAALSRLAEGGAILVSRELHEARNLSMGDQVELYTLEGVASFEVAGVVASQGLDVAVQAFGIENAYEQAALSSVFGTRQDARRYFGVDAVNLVLAELNPAASDELAVTSLREAAPSGRVGTSRMIQRRVERHIDGVLAAGSTLSGIALVISCLGVWQLMLADLAARRREHGILRSIGATRSLLARLMVGQAIIVGIAGAILGAALGLELVWMLRDFHRRLLGLVYQLHPAWDVIAWGSLALVAAAVLATMPAAIKLLRTQPREML